MTGSPGEGKGSRKLDCDLYDTCLDLAAKKDWDGFHCEGCTHEADQVSARDAGVTDVTGKAKALCSDCQEKETLGNSPYCASCLGVRGNRAKAAKAKSKRAEKPEKAKKTQSKPKSKKAQGKANTALTIEFGKHVSILRQIESLADREIRPVDCQVIYMLKTQLARVEAGQPGEPMPTP